VRDGHVVGFDDQRDIRLLRWAVAGLLLGGLLALAARGADGPADPYLRAASGSATVGSATASSLPPSTASVRTPLPGFTEIAFRVLPGPGLTHCALLADTPAARQRGLMGRHDLAGYDGMLFVFQADTTETFFMRDTPIPLSIAWFDANGRFVGATDMTPCLERANCPTYTAPRAYRRALETPRGGLGALGIGAGSQVMVGGAC
jgi:uncharacterized protein